VAGIGQLRMETVIRGVMPFLSIYMAMLVLLILFPAIVLWPLKLMF
jgi:TRAP-type C4-dicarboxylate transport system permease large subunit